MYLFDVALFSKLKLMVCKLKICVILQVQFINTMKLFLDTADTELIEKHFQTDLIDGITTNPTLIMKSGRDPEDVYQQLIDLGIDDISMEVVGDFDEMYMEGLRLSRKFGKNATIKVPCTPAGLKVCKKLSRDLVNVNVTLIF